MSPAVQMIELPTLSLAIGGGILVTAVLGLLCGPFLDARVTVKFPYEFEDFKDSKVWEARNGTS